MKTQRVRLTRTPQQVLQVSDFVGEQTELGDLPEGQLSLHPLHLG